MFQTIKENVSLLAVAELLYDMKFTPAGDKTYEPEDKECVFCGHKDCLKLKEDGEESILKCFSCDEAHDVISLTAKVKGIEPKDAALLLAKQFKVKLPSRTVSPVQELFNTALNYYHARLLEEGASSVLGGKTPLEYQEQNRHHSKATLEHFRVGWSDGKLIEFLDAMGYDKELVKSSGLINRAGKDFLPYNSFIYAHMVKGQVSHFTFKDPQKKFEYQIPNKNRLNGVTFYNQDSIKKGEPTILVEGENDCLSVYESGWTGGILCCNGSISASQLEWISANLEGKNVITIFDADEAGDKYRDKLSKMARTFSSLKQVKVSGVKDIDDYLKAGGSLTGLLNSPEAEVTVEAAFDSEDTSPILERQGAYFKSRFKDGQEYFIKLTNFTIKLRNIYILENSREREIIIIREDGFTSKPVKVSSESKVSLKAFRTLISNAVDASFYGKEEDLTYIWEYVYKHCLEKIVYLPSFIGYIEDFNGWLFDGVFFSNTGSTYTADAEGVIWIQNNTIGIKPYSLVTSGREHNKPVGVPRLDSSLSFEEREVLLEKFVRNLAENLGNVGDAVTVVGWLWASVYSQFLTTQIYRWFPFLYLRGRSGAGKSYIIQWIMSIFDMQESGYTTLPQMNSGVSFGRKIAYYSHLPMCIDELRIGGDAVAWYGKFRGWYNRSGDAISSKDSNGVVERPIKSTLIFGGEDQFTDAATRARCIQIRVANEDKMAPEKRTREMVKTYAWMEANFPSFSAIGYHWISNYSSISPTDIKQGIASFEDTFKKMDVPARMAQQWALITFFADKLKERYFPDYDYIKYAREAAQGDFTDEQEESMTNTFWQTIELLTVNPMDNPISANYITYDGKSGSVYVWFAALYKFFEKETRHLQNEKFSKAAIKQALTEEPYFIKEGHYRLNNSNNQRCLQFNLTNCPETLQNILRNISEI